MFFSILSYCPSSELILWITPILRSLVHGNWSGEYAWKNTVYHTAWANVIWVSTTLTTLSLKVLQEKAYGYATAMWYITLCGRNREFVDIPLNFPHLTRYTLLNIWNLVYIFQFLTGDWKYCPFVRYCEFMAVVYFIVLSPTQSYFTFTFYIILIIKISWLDQILGVVLPIC